MARNLLYLFFGVLPKLSLSSNASVRGPCCLFSQLISIGYRGLVGVPGFFLPPTEVVFQPSLFCAKKIRTLIKNKGFLIFPVKQKMVALIGQHRVFSLKFKSILFVYLSAAID